MAQGDLKIANSVKNEILKHTYSVSGGINNEKIYFTLNHDTTQNRLGRFIFENGIATLQSSVNFDVIVTNDPIVINKIYLGYTPDIDFAGVATINLVGDEIKTFNESGALSIMTLTIELREVNS